MTRGVKTQLKINDKERTLLLKAGGTARHAYNWGLDQCIKNLREGKHVPSSKDLHKLLTPHPTVPISPQKNVEIKLKLADDYVLHYPGFAKVA